MQIEMNAGRLGQQKLVIIIRGRLQRKIRFKLPPRGNTVFPFLAANYEIYVHSQTCPGEISFAPPALPSAHDLIPRKNFEIKSQVLARIKEMPAASTKF